MDPVVHFELPYDERDRIAAFYESAFGWQMEKLGGEMNDYVLARTADSDDIGPLARGVINGGFFARVEHARHPSIVINVDDLRASVRKVTAAGGRVIGEPQELPGIGLYAQFADTEGNQLGMLQPAPRPPGGG